MGQAIVMNGHSDSNRTAPRQGLTPECVWLLETQTKACVGRKLRYLIPINIKKWFSNRV
jgi:hypothetical protein